MRRGLNELGPTSYVIIPDLFRKTTELKEYRLRDVRDIYAGVSKLSQEKISEIRVAIRRAVKAHPKVEVEQWENSTRYSLRLEYGKRRKGFARKVVVMYFDE